MHIYDILNRTIDLVTVAIRTCKRQWLLIRYDSTTPPPPPITVAINYELYVGYGVKLK